MTGRPIVGNLPGPWVEQAACAHEATQVWFRSGATTLQAVAVCHTCPVKADCLDHALTHREHGVWGGTTDLMRRRIRQGRPPGTPGRVLTCSECDDTFEHSSVGASPRRCPACRGVL